MLNPHKDLEARADILPLTTRALCLESDGKMLLDNICLDIKAGSRSVVLGPNGAGKSLLLRVMHGLIRPTKGDVLWAGARTDAKIRARQAMVFQHPVLLRRSTLANIRFVLDRHRPGERGLSRIDRTARSQSYLELAGLEQRANLPARLLSGGEQQRLAIARALALDPDILFLDEPTASLDPAATQAVEQLIQAVHEGRTKIVLVTHDIGQARRLADDVVFLHHGQVVEQTSADSFFNSPQSDAACAFLDGRIVT